MHFVLDDNEYATALARQKDPTAAGFEPARVTPIDFESIALTARPSCLDNPPQTTTHTPALAHSYAHCKRTTRTQHTPAPRTPCTTYTTGYQTSTNAIYTLVRSQCILQRRLRCACVSTPSHLLRVQHTCTQVLVTASMHVQSVLDAVLHLQGHTVVCVAQENIDGTLVGH